MTKKLTILILVYSVLLIPSKTMAALDVFYYGYFGTTSETSKIIIADHDPDVAADVWTDVTAGGGNGQVVWYGRGTKNIIGTSPTPGKATAPSEAVAFGLKSLNGSEVYAIEANSTNSYAPYTKFCGARGSAECSEDGSDGSDGSDGCDSCGMFECPGWSEYMGKLEGIKAAIPPAPNWDNVADKFRDSIAPRIKEDMRQLLGGVTERPAAPKAPKSVKVNKPIAPQQPGGLNDRGIKAPTGQEAPGLEDAGFNKGKIEKEAEVIKERQDPTGGIEVLNPLDKLPSQDEFKGLQPIPEEGISPYPKEGEIERPTPPKESENKAPTPSVGDYKAPTPGNSDNKAPTPGESENKAPTPGNSDNKAPTPGENENKAPTPSQGDYKPPTPGNSGGFYGPIPGASDNTAPLPGGD